MHSEYICHLLALPEADLAAIFSCLETKFFG